MSQLGRCSCGQTFVKIITKDSATNNEVTVEVCPRCDFHKSAVLEKGMEKAVKKDKFGFEILEK